LHKEITNKGKHMNALDLSTADHRAVADLFNKDEATPENGDHLHHASNPSQSEFLIAYYSQPAPHQIYFGQETVRRTAAKRR